jgi:hypothetical protein
MYIIHDANGRARQQASIQETILNHRPRKGSVVRRAGTIVFREHDGAWLWLGPGEGSRVCGVNVAAMIP